MPIASIINLSSPRCLWERASRRSALLLLKTLCKGTPVATLCAAFVLLTAALDVARGDWLTHRGNPQRTGAADDLPGPKSAKVLWVHRTREHFVAAPVPGGKEVYLSS